ncbi:DUF3108 domain-containing protein [Rhizobium sp. LC145]|uniref:DUF3108 domain-containing protein n=1 Tax=Rhizobium sp. LC145 TaxID=1120688 RepID=UPI000629EDC2|nr:DUF3108 domain-containing protein [Rhizobium sp. LC145]KKX27912.1 hypothetical protein YH62_21630 [Rhizobium sp. LC145]TKT57093.1 DUF3108 domain-containing protein [Rhizobiaceae bacterium LC148]
MVLRARSVLALVVAVALAPVSAGTAEIRHVSEYDISLGVLPIAKASFASEFGSSDYKISGTFRSSGLVDIITRISAQTTVSGRKRGDRLEAQRYNLVYRNGKRTRIYDVTYRNGNVTETTVKPEPRRPENWVPVTEKDLQAVLDPLSGLVFPADAKVCPNRLPIYDGESRMDLVLTPKGTRQFSTKGFKGEAIVCDIRYVPKSGYRQGRSDIEFLRKTSMEIWFAKAQSVNVYAPVYARIPTRMGQVYVTAVKYGD